MIYSDAFNHDLITRKEALVLLDRHHVSADEYTDFYKDNGYHLTYSSDVVKVWLGYDNSEVLH